MLYFEGSVFYSLLISLFVAYPLHRYARETTWTDSNANKAHDKINLSKDVEWVDQVKDFKPAQYLKLICTHTLKWMFEF